MHLLFATRCTDGDGVTSAGTESPIVMAHPPSSKLGALEGLVRSLGRVFTSRRADPLATRLDQAGSAGTPLTPDEAADIAAARDEVKRGEYTTDPLGHDR